MHVARAATAALLTLGATFTLTTVASPADAAPPSSGPDVVAHRGSSGAAPENTLAAIKLALDHRSDTVENDIQRTSDGELVIMHDVTLTRTTDVEEVFPDRAPWNVGDFTLAEIKRLDAGSWFAPEFAGQRVPTLEQWVKAVGRRAGMLLEPKSPELYPGIEQDLDKELRSPARLQPGAARRQGRRAVVQPRVAARVRRPRSRRTRRAALRQQPTDADIAAAATWADQVNPALGVIDEATVDAIHAADMETHVWTVNAGQDMRRAINWDVDGIITNYPQVLRDILRRG